MKLTKKEENLILDSEHQFINLDGVEYFCKYAEGGGIELVANKLAGIVGINCSKDYIVNINDELYYLSYSFYNIGDFKRGSDLMINKMFFSNSMYDLWKVFEKDYPHECQKLMFDLVKVFIFDIFLLNGDRHIGNFVVLNENGKHSLYIYDNDNVFEAAFKALIDSRLSSKDELKKYSEIDLGQYTTLSMEKNIKSLEYFLATSSKEFNDLVVKFYHKLTPEVVESTFIEIEQNENIIIEDKEYDMKLYKENYRLIGDLLIERGLINGQRIH